MGGKPPKQEAFPESLEGPTMKKKKKNELWMPDVESIKERTFVNNTETRVKGYSIPMKGSHGEHWYGETGDRTGSKTPSKPQSTQQRKPTWLVKCNCPTRRSWQSNKAVTLVLRRT